MQGFCSSVASWDHLPRQEGVNHTYFTYDSALWRLQRADGGASIKSRIPAFLRVIVNSRGLIIRILRMIVHLGGYSSQMGALIIRTLRMIVHLGVFMLQLGGF